MRDTPEPQPSPAVDDVPVTVTEAIGVLVRHGYTADFELVDGVLRTHVGTTRCSIDAAMVEHLYRFEGPSDPGDEMIVFGLVDPETGVRGTLAAAYGPSADPVLYDYVVRFESRRE